MQAPTASNAHLKRWQPVLLLAAALSLALGLYYRVFGLPLFMDDVIMMWVTQSSRPLDLFFTPMNMEAYYRPMSLLPTRLAQLISGGSDPLLLHALNFSFYTLNCWLASLIARRLYPQKPAFPYITLALYAAFPFMYEAVHWHASIQQLVAATGMLFGLFFADRWWETTRWTDFALALMSVFTASFSHETGNTLLPLFAGWLLIKHYDLSLRAAFADWRRILTFFLPAFAIVALYLVGRSQAPRLDTQAQIVLAEIPANFLYLLQGLTYPFAQFGGALSRSGIPEQRAALLLVSAGLLIIFLNLIFVVRDRRGWIGPAWYVFVAAIPAFFLHSNYVFNGPRLMTPAAFGAALAWAAIIVALWERLNGAWRAVPAVLAVFILGSSTYFVQTRLDLHDILRPLYTEVYANADRQETLMYINLPTWIAPRDKVYALGSEGVIYQGGFFPFEELIWANTGTKPSDVGAYVWEAAVPDLPGFYIPPIDQHTPDFDGLITAIAQADQVYSSVVLGDELTWQSGQAVDTLPRGDTAAFENGVTLVASATLSEIVTLMLTWELDHPVSEVAFVHVLCDGVLVAQNDGPPLGGLYPFERWQPGQRWQETRLITLPPNAAPACLSINAGLYDPASGTRVPLVDGGDALQVAITQ